MKPFLLLFVFFTLAACQDNTDKGDAINATSTSKLPSSHDVSLNLFVSAHDMLGLNFTINSISLVTEDASITPLINASAEVLIQGEQQSIQLTRKTLPEGRYAALELELTVAKEPVLPFLSQTGELEVKPLSVLSSREGKLQSLFVQIIAPINLNRDIALALVLDSRRTLDVVSAHTIDGPLVFAPALHLYENINGHLKSLTAKRDSGIQQAVMNHETLSSKKVPYVIKTLKEQSVVLEGVEGPKEVSLDDLQLRSTADQVLSKGQLLQGQKVFLQQGRLIVEPMQLTARVQNVKRSDQQVFVEPLMLNGLSVSESYQKGQSFLGTVQLKRRKGAESALLTALSNEDMSALFLSDQVAAGMLIDFYGYPAPEQPVFDLMYAKVVNLSALALSIMAPNEAKLDVDVIQKQQAVQLAFKQKGVQADLKLIDHPIFVQETIQAIAIEQPTHVLLKKRVDDKLTLVALTTEDVPALFESIKSGYTDLKEITATGDFKEGKFYANRLELTIGTIETRPETETEPKVDTDTSQTSTEGDDNDSVIHSASSVSTGAIVGSAAGAGVALILASGVIYKAVTVYKRYVSHQAPQASARGRSRASSHPLVEPMLPVLVAEDSSVTNNTDAEEDKSVYQEDTFSALSKEGRLIIHQKVSDYLEQFPAIPEDLAKEVVEEAVPDEVKTVAEQLKAALERRQYNDANSELSEEDDSDEIRTISSGYDTVFTEDDYRSWGWGSDFDDSEFDGDDVSTIKYDLSEQHLIAHLKKLEQQEGGKDDPVYASVKNVFNESYASLNDFLEETDNKGYILARDRLPENDRVSQWIADNEEAMPLHNYGGSSNTKLTLTPAKRSQVKEKLKQLFKSRRKKTKQEITRAMIDVSETNTNQWLGTHPAHVKTVNSAHTVIDPTLPKKTGFFNLNKPFFKGRRH